MMFSSILKIVFFSFIIYKTTEAAVALYPAEAKPLKFAKQEGCFLSSLQRVLDVVVPYSPQDGVSCEQYLCKEDGVTQLFTCGVKAVSEGCLEIEGNKTLPYPDCCNIVRCTKEDGTYTDF